MATEQNFNSTSRPNDLQASLGYLFDSGAGVFRPIQRHDLRTTGSMYASNHSASGSFGVCLQENLNRKSFFIQNLSPSGSLFVKLGNGVSQNSFNFILKAETALNAGNGGSYSDDVWKGEVSATGEALMRFISWEV